jgi:hypothetical protein
MIATAKNPSVARARLAALVLAVVADVAMTVRNSVPAAATKWICPWGLRNKPCLTMQI